jgi:serine/threonine protein phosphatase 1
VTPGQATSQRITMVKSPQQNPHHPQPRIPRGRRIYAIGDIHGRLDLLELLHDAILEDAQTATGKRKTLIHLGDYIDRGPDSFGVVDRLSEFTNDDFDVINLKGNHEDFLIRFVQNESKLAPLLDVWRNNGCIETLLSYGIDIRDPGEQSPDEEARHIRNLLSDAIPKSHMAFYRNLKLRHTIGDYLFVHAGINPDLPMNRQTKTDLIWIRNRFLSHAGPFEKVIVHGHSISNTPEVLDHRIGIDTGAYFSNRLTCLVLEDNERHFIET